MGGRVHLARRHDAEGHQGRCVAPVCARACCVRGVVPVSPKSALDYLGCFWCAGRPFNVQHVSHVNKDFEWCARCALPPLLLILPRCAVADVCVPWVRRSGGNVEDMFELKNKLGQVSLRALCCALALRGWA